MTRVVLVTGAGGVGKTTVAAALAATAASAGHATLVLTVDPARRLADALGLESLHNDPTPVPALAGLDAAMLDVTAAWEEMVQRNAEPDVAARLLANPFFRAIADRFPAAQAYAGGEEMLEYVEAGRWDVVVIDTPPSGGGLDFFSAPRRMRDLIGGKLLRWITGSRIPGRRTIYRLTARPVLRLADTILGGPLLEEIAEFFIDLRALYDGVARRSRDIEAAFASATTWVITTADPTPMREARRFFEELSSHQPDTVVFNRTLPAEWAGAPPAPPGDVAAANLERWGSESRRQADARQLFGAQHSAVPATIPWSPDPPTDLAALQGLVEHASGLRLPWAG